MSSPAVDQGVAEGTIGVVNHGIDMLPALGPSVAITLIICCTIVLIAVTAIWRWRPARPDVSGNDVQAMHVIAAITEEFGRSSANLRDAVDELSALVRGCSTCSYNPHRPNNGPEQQQHRKKHDG